MKFDIQYMFHSYGHLFLAVQMVAISLKLIGCLKFCTTESLILCVARSVGIQVL